MYTFLDGDVPRFPTHAIYGAYFSAHLLCEYIQLIAANSYT